MLIQLAIFPLLIFLWGLLVSSVLGFFERDDNVTVFLGRTFGLGLSYWVIFDSLRIFVPISLDLSLVLATCFPVGCLSLLPRNRLRPRIPRFDGSDVWVLLLVAIQSVVLIVYFWEYPFFPNLSSFDFSAHLEYVSQFAQGVTPNLSTALFYNGIHFLLSIAVLGDSEFQMLFAIRAAMAIVIVMSDFILYYACSRIFSRSPGSILRDAALWVCAVYVVSGFVWLDIVLGSGLYPNFYGLVASLLLLGVSVDIVDRRLRANHVAGYVIFCIAIVNSLFSHYSIIFMIPTVLVYLGVRKKVGALALVLTPLVLVVVLFQGLVAMLIGFLGSGGPVEGLAPLSQSLSVWPVLAYTANSMATESVYGSLFAVTVLALVAFFVVVAFREKGLKSLLITWLLPILVFAPFSSNAWRFAYVALMPMTLMVGYIASRWAGRGLHASRGRARKPMPRQYRLFSFLFIAVCLLGSQSGHVFSQALTSGATSHLQQDADYQAMIWIDRHIPRNQTVMSVSDWRFAYAQALGGPSELHTLDEVNGSWICAQTGPSQVLRLAYQVNARYIVVTDASTLSDCPPSLRPWLTFSTQTLGCSSNCIVYEDQWVRVFRVA